MRLPAAPKLVLLLAAAALVLGAAAASVTFVTPVMVEASAATVDNTDADNAQTGLHTEGGEHQDSPNHRTTPEGHTEAAQRNVDRARIALRVAEARAQGRTVPAQEDSSVYTPYTYANSQPAYRSTYLRYPWMHEAFGRKPSTPHPRFPIGAHIEFPWQKEAREEYADQKLREHEKLEAQLRSHGGPETHMPNPLPFAPKGEAWMTSHPFGPPPGSYPYYPMPHPELMQSFDQDGNAQASNAVHPAVAHEAAMHAIANGAAVHPAMLHPDVAAHAMAAGTALHPDAHSFGYYGAALGASPYAVSAGVSNPYYSPHPFTTAAGIAASHNGAYGNVGWYQAGVRDII